MKITKLLLLSLVCGSLTAHSGGLLDRYVYKHILQKTHKDDSHAVQALKKAAQVLAPNDEECIEEIVPGINIAKFHVPLYGKVHLNTQKLAKCAAFLGVVGVNIKEAFEKNAKQQKPAASADVVLKQGKDVLYDTIKDSVVDNTQEFIADRLPKSIQEMKMHWLARRALRNGSGALLSVGYDLAYNGIKYGIKNFAAR